LEILPGKLEKNCSAGLRSPITRQNLPSGPQVSKG